MGQTLKIGVSREPPNSGIVSCRKVTMRERMLQRLLGKKQRLTILVPGDSVKSLSITEEGGGSGETEDVSEFDKAMRDFHASVDAVLATCKSIQEQCESIMATDSASDPSESPSTSDEGGDKDV